MKKLLLAIFIGSCLNVNSQVYSAGTIYSAYYDINPDTLINYTVYPYTNEVYDFNLFDDPLSKIELTARGAVSSGGSDAYIKVASLNPNVYIRFGRLDSVYVPANSNWNITKVAKPLNTGDSINAANANWDNGELYLTDHTGHGGGNKNVNDWIGRDKYIGLKYQNGGSVSYDWIRLQCIAQDSCYIKDFSYSSPSLAVHEIEQDKIKLYPNPANGIFYLRSVIPNAFEMSRLKLEDIYGREVKFTYEVKADEIKIDLDPNLSEGCYLLQYFSNNYMFSKKIVKNYSIGGESEGQAIWKSSNKIK